MCSSIDERIIVFKQVQLKEAPDIVAQGLFIEGQPKRVNMRALILITSVARLLSE